MKLLLLLLLFFLHAQAFAHLKEPYTIEAIENYIIDKKVTTIPEFIEGFDQNTKSNFVLMHTSHSLHGATYQKPRALVFSKTAQLVFSFNGDNSQKNGDKIELILFDKTKATFSAHEIDFGSRKPKVIKNPQSCIGCHGSDLRPNWNGYNFWSGAYGSNDGRLSSAELDEVKRFVQSAKDHPRYRHLQKLSDQAALINKSDIGSRTKKAQTIINFTEHIVDMNLLRVKRILTSHPEYKDFKAALLTLFACGEDFFRKTLPEDKKMIFTKIDSLSRDTKMGYGEYRDKYFENFMNLLGVDTQFLDTSFNIQYFRSSVHHQVISKYSKGGLDDQYLFKLFSKNDSAIYPFIINVEKGGMDVDCQSLADEGKKGLETLSFQSISSQSVNQDQLTQGKKVFQNVCLECHKNDDFTGYSFKPESLIERFKEDPSSYDHFVYRLNKDTPVENRMPLNREISPEDRAAVQIYIKSFLDQ
ncbi:MAG: hypothetical protein LW878_13715 [Proteobacteria bacterium]|nr:hypothetical protein [Pseudomonadota bacterium]